MSDPTAVLGLEPDDLDGHTIDELSDYLEHHRQPAVPSIDNSPACQIALGALQRLRTLASTYLDPDDDESRGTDQDWISAVLATIPIDARAGRHFPWPGDAPRLAAHTTEGAIRGLIRAIGDEVPGILVGSVRIESGEPARLEIDVALVYGTMLPAAAEALRATVRRGLVDHVPLVFGPIDINVVGLIRVTAPSPNGRNS